MPTTLTIRNLGEAVKRKLRIQAAMHGRAMEAEAREILTRAVMDPPKSPPEANAPEKKACASVRGMWKGRFKTDEIMTLTRGD